METSGFYRGITKVKGLGVILYRGIPKVEGLGVASYRDITKDKGLGLKEQKRQKERKTAVILGQHVYRSSRLV